jgi:Fur family peroxide stress response transcriptional regulator
MTVEMIKENRAWQGKRMTRQRRIIYECLVNRKDHPAVESLYQTVKPKFPKLSLQTVYRTISLFEEMGLVRRVAIYKGHIRYDADMQPHSHFLCEDCGIVMDVQSPRIPWMDIVCEAGRLGAVQSGEVLLKGICHGCGEHGMHRGELRTMRLSA